MPDLTVRERDVLEHVCAGKPTKAIAADLGISQQAVKAHLTRLFVKYGAENRAGLVAKVMRNGTGAGTEARRRAVARSRDARTRSGALVETHQRLIRDAFRTLGTRSRRAS